MKIQPFTQGLQLQLAKDAHSIIGLQNSEVVEQGTQEGYLLLQDVEGVTHFSIPNLY